MPCSSRTRLSRSALLQTDEGCCHEASRIMGDGDRSDQLCGHRHDKVCLCRRKERATTCSLATVKGRYLFATSGTNFPPAAPQQLFARAGYRIFNGDGTGTIITTTSENGVIVVADSVSDLSYTVNMDCTGTFEILSTGATAEFFVAPNGEEMVVIVTSKGTSDAFTSRRVGPE
jgi:hypothetical protein